MAGALRTIDKMASCLNKQPDKNISVEGHTDSTGSERFNNYQSVVLTLFTPP